MASRNLILHNFWWKLLSLLLAALMWLYIATESQRDERIAAASREVVTENWRTFSAIPITLLTSPANTNQYFLEPSVVSVTVGAEDQKALDDLQERRVRAFVDVTDTEDEKQFRKPIQASVPEGFQVESTFPSNASVERITSPR